MPKFFINRPIVAMVISILTVIVGAITISTLPVAQYPNIVPPEIQISAYYLGADAQTIEEAVATPIEQQMSGVDNMNYMTSVNATGQGRMGLTVNFDVKTDPNVDLILTQMRQALAVPQLPFDVTNYGVSVMKSLSAPLMLIAFYSPHGTYDEKFMGNYAYINLNDQTLEGLSHRKLPAFSVQYHPEASPGRHDARYLFDQFINSIKSTKHQTV